MDEGGVRAEDRKHFNKRQEVDDLEDDDEEEEYDDEDEEEDNVRLTTNFMTFSLVASLCQMANSKKRVRKAKQASTMKMASATERRRSQSD